MSPTGFHRVWCIPRKVSVQKMD